MVILGAYNACANVVDNGTIIICLEKIMGERKKHLIPMNERAIELGKRAALAQM
jgi:2-oxoglutarate ferredoxin oxidoreductase subunit gamma